MQQDVETVLAHFRGEVDTLCGQLARKRDELEIQALARLANQLVAAPVAPITGTPGTPAEQPDAPPTPIARPTEPWPHGVALPVGRPPEPAPQPLGGGGLGTGGTPAWTHWGPGRFDPEPVMAAGGTVEGVTTDTETETCQPPEDDPIVLGPDPGSREGEIKTPEQANRVAREVVASKGWLGWIWRILRF